MLNSGRQGSARMCGRQMLPPLRAACAAEGMLAVAGRCVRVCACACDARVRLRACAHALACCACACMGYACATTLQNGVCVRELSCRGLPTWVRVV